MLNHQATPAVIVRVALHFKHVVYVLKQITYMEEIFKRLQVALGTKEPTITSFRNALRTLPEKERESMKRDIFALAFLYWPELAKYQQGYVETILGHEPEMLLTYLIKDTVLGALRYPVKEPESFCKFFHIFSKSKMNHKISTRHLAFSLLLGFDIPLKVRTLAEYIHRKKPDADDVFGFVQRLDID